MKKRKNSMWDNIKNKPAAFYWTAGLLIVGAIITIIFVIIDS